ERERADPEERRREQGAREVVDAERAAVPPVRRPPGHRGGRGREREESDAPGVAAAAQQAPRESEREQRGAERQENVHGRSLVNWKNISSKRCGASSHYPGATADAATLQPWRSGTCSRPGRRRFRRRFWPPAPSPSSTTAAPTSARSTPARSPG